MNYEGGVIPPKTYMDDADLEQYPDKVNVVKRYRMLLRCYLVHRTLHHESYAVLEQHKQMAAQKACLGPHVIFSAIRDITC